MLRNTLSSSVFEPAAGGRERRRMAGSGFPSLLEWGISEAAFAATTLIPRTHALVIKSSVVCHAEMNVADNIADY